MKHFKRILLASHGTVGALEAEKEALLLCADNANISLDRDSGFLEGNGRQGLATQPGRKPRL